MGLKSGVLIVRAVVALMLAVALGACAAPVPSPSVPVQEVAIPDEGRAAMDRCMAAAGFVVHPARSGSNAVYSWERPSYYTWSSGDQPRNAVAAAACGARFDPPREMTDPELREIYKRWVLERTCLITLGFSPKEPPSFEEFRQDWRTTGPWMPIDGIPFNRITGEAKELCGLEMVN